MCLCGEKIIINLAFAKASKQFDTNRTSTGSAVTGTLEIRKHSLINDYY